MVRSGGKSLSGFQAATFFFVVFTILYTGAATVESSTEVSLKTELPCEPAIPFLGIYPKKKKQNTNSKRYMHPSVHNSIIHNSQDMKAI